MANRIAKSLPIDDSNHSEDLRLKITYNRVVKTQILTYIVYFNFIIVYFNKF